MDIENQVVSLELAKKMKELGFGQESEWYWVINQDSAFTDWCLESQRYIKYYKKDNKEYYPAYTVAELGEMLPKIIENLYKLEIWYRGNNCIVEYPANDYTDCKLHRVEADTEANARAKMLIWLKENNL